MTHSDSTITIEPARGGYSVYLWSADSGRQRKTLVERFEFLGDAELTYPQAKVLKHSRPIPQFIVGSAGAASGHAHGNLEG